jgi:transketolase
MSTDKEIEKRCGEAASRMRKNAVKLAYAAGVNGSHIGGGLSIIEILAVLYCGIMKIKKEDPRWKERDRFILSKGDGSLALYAALEAAHIITADQLDAFQKNGGPLPCVAESDAGLGIEFSGGTLGYGLSYAAGLALASGRSGHPFHVYALLGDGECNEGSVWEAAMFAVHNRLSNLTVIIDLNKMQSDGKTEEVMNIPLEEMWKGIGWETLRVSDGHDISMLLCAFERPLTENKPRVIIAETVKGKGVSFMENNNEWHFNILPKELFELAIKEISEKERQL